MTNNEKLGHELNKFLLDYLKDKEQIYHSPYFLSSLCAAIEKYTEVDTGEILKIAGGYWEM